MKDYKGKNILHNNNSLAYTLGQLKNTKVGQKFTDADGKEKEIKDSKVVAKRKRDIRGAQILETSFTVTKDRLANFKNINANISWHFIDWLAIILSSEIAKFVCTIVGSPRYDRIVSKYV